MSSYARFENLSNRMILRASVSGFAMLLIVLEALYWLADAIPALAVILVPVAAGVAIFFFLHFARRRAHEDRRRDPRDPIKR